MQTSIYNKVAAMFCPTIGLWTGVAKTLTLNALENHRPKNGEKNLTKLDIQPTKFLKFAIRHDYLRKTTKTAALSALTINHNLETTGVYTEIILLLIYQMLWITKIVQLATHATCHITFCWPQWYLFALLTVAIFLVKFGAETTTKH